jgi:hypothetical protein
MSKSLAVAIAITLLLGLQCVGFAASPDEIAKWSQLPDMNDGHQFSSEIKVPSIVADDWICPDGRPVTDIHWWGGYWAPTAEGQYSDYSDGLTTVLTPGTLQTFTINIWSNEPAGGPEPYSRPGGILATYVFDLADAHEAFYGTTVLSGRNLYEYYVDLPQPFNQVQGTTYWLTIKADMPATSVQWGWQESNDHRVSPAVNDYKGSGWVQIQNNSYDNDMAFELTTIPEPAGLSAMGVGLVSMATFFFRRRKQ